MKLAGHHILTLSEAGSESAQKYKILPKQNFTNLREFLEFIDFTLYKLEYLQVFLQ